MFPFSDLTPASHLTASKSMSLVLGEITQTDAASDLDLLMPHTIVMINGTAMMCDNITGVGKALALCLCKLGSAQFKRGTQRALS